MTKYKVILSHLLPFVSAWIAYGAYWMGYLSYEYAVLLLLVWVVINTSGGCHD